MLANELSETNGGEIPVDRLYQELALNIDEIDPEQKYLLRYDWAFVALETLDFSQEDSVSEYNNMLLSTIGLADKVEIFVDPKLPDSTLHLPSGRSCKLERYNGEKLKIQDKEIWVDWPLEPWISAPKRLKKHNCLLILSPGQSGGFALNVMGRCHRLEVLHMYSDDDISSNLMPFEAVEKNIFWPLRLTQSMLRVVERKDWYFKDFREFLEKRKTETSQTTQKNHIDRLLKTSYRMSTEIDGFVNKLLLNTEVKLDDHNAHKTHPFNRLVNFISIRGIDGRGNI